MWRGGVVFSCCRTVAVQLVFVLDEGGVVGVDLGEVFGGAAVGEVAVEDEVGEGVGAEFVEGALASGLAGGAGVAVDDGVGGEGFGGAEVGVDVAGGVAGVGAVADGAAVDVVFGVAAGVVGVDL